MRRKNKGFKYSILIVVLLLFVAVGYSAIRTGLNINGLANVVSPTWDVHFENYQATANSNVTPSTAPITPSGAKPTTVAYEVTLNNPGDIYEFTLDVVNQGTLDVMIESFSTKLNNAEVDSTHPIPNYLEYSVAYDNGIALANKQLLAQNTKEKIKLRVKYRDDIDISDLPSTQQDLNFVFTIVYEQADDTAIPVSKEADFVNDSWSDIINAYRAGKTTNLEYAMNNGLTKGVRIDIDLDGTFDWISQVRIANLSTPAECSTSGFSQTACGFVIEFATNSFRHRMQSTATNVGGFPATEVYPLLTSETPNTQSMYNAIMDADLRSAIIPTYVVTGHGSTAGETNTTTTDKLYLLSSVEVWGSEGAGDSLGLSLTRQLDYYKAIGVTSSNYSGAIKRDTTGSIINWWLRSPGALNDTCFRVVTDTGSNTNVHSTYNYAVVPAFRLA